MEINHIFVPENFYKDNQIIISKIKNLISFLWENPKIVFQLISNMEENKLQDIIPFLINNFYQNIFSTNILENHLLYIILLLISKEIDLIDNFSSLEDKKKFLEGNLLNIFLDEILKIPEMQKYFKVILQNVIEEVNVKSNGFFIIDNTEILMKNKINFDIKNIEEIITTTIAEKEKEQENGKSSKSKMKTEIDFMKQSICSISSIQSSINIPQKLFVGGKDDFLVEKYFEDVTKEVLESKMKDENTSLNMKEFYNFQIKLFNIMNQGNLNKNIEIFSNKVLLKDIYKSPESIKIANVYKRYFAFIITTINGILDNMKKYSNSFPYSLKIIFKAIVILFKKKFDNKITNVEIYYFLGKFLFNKILLPFFLHPEDHCFTSSLAIFSDDTYYNLEIISIIINKFYSGYLFFYEDNGGTLNPFNAYFLDKIPELYKIFEDITDVNLPEGMQEFLESKSLENFDYHYSYFNEYKNEILYHQSCCLSFYYLFYIVKLIKTNNLFENNQKFKEIFENIINDKNLIDMLNEKRNKKPEQIKIKKNTIQKINAEYFIINQITFNTNLKDINDDCYLNNKCYMQFNNMLSDDKKTNENYFITKIKTALCEILNVIPYITYLITQSIINKKSLNNISLILTDILHYQLYLSQNKNFNQIKEFLPFEYSASILVDNIDQIPEKYSKNNYELLFNEIKNELNNAISNLELDTLSQFYNNFLILSSKKEIYQKNINKIAKISFKKEINKIINQIPINLKVKINNNSVEFKQSKFNSKKMKLNIYYDKKKNIIIFKTIETFVRNFFLINDIGFDPTSYITTGNKLDAKDIFDYLKYLNLPQLIINFFTKELRIILTENGLFESPNNTLISRRIDVIYDFVISNIYNLIYRYLPSDKDKNFKNKCKMLSWTNITNFIKNNAKLFGNLAIRIGDCFKRLAKRQTPFEKYLCLKEICEYLKNIPCDAKIKYILENNSVLLLNPVLIYGIIKAENATFISDIKFIRMFNLEKNTTNEKMLDDLINGYINYILDISHEDLIDVEEEEFKLKCFETIDDNDD